MSRIFALAAFVTSLFAFALTSHGALFQYAASLNGANESPPNGSPATGNVEVDYNDALHTLRLFGSFSGFPAGDTTTAAHIHAATSSPLTGTAGVATVMPTFPGFPLTVTSGAFDSTLDLTSASSWNPAYVTAHTNVAGAEAALATALAAEESYFNIHTVNVGGGEIRGFLTPVPEPATFGLGALGAMGLLAIRSRMKRSR
jgi:hypothetical protein